MSDDTTTKKIESLSEDERLFRIFNSKDISCISLWILNLKMPFIWFCDSFNCFPRS
jgi:hypothetical protein